MLSDEEIAARTRVTLKAANVTGQDTADVSEQLTAVWSGYKVSAQEAELYVDKLAAVAATTASDLEELSIGMSRVASSAALMGVDVDQLNAQLSTIISVTRQAPETVGVALKSIYARMTDIEAGLDSETSLGNYTKEMYKYGVNVINANNELRDMGEVIEEVGKKWADMSREQQVGLAQAIAGSRQYNVLLALFDNWENYESTIETSRNAMGTLQQQQDTYMESTQAHLQTLRTTWEDLYDSILDSNTIIKFTDLTTGAVDKIRMLVDSIGGGGNALLNLGSIATMVFSKQLGQGLVTSINNFEKAKYNASLLKAEIESLGAIRNSDAMQDPAIAQLVGKKEELQAYYSLLSNEEINQGTELLRQLKDAKNSELEWQGLTEQVVNFSNELFRSVGYTEDVIENISELDFTNATNTAEEFQVALRGANIEAQNTFEAIQNYNQEREDWDELDMNHDWAASWTALDDAIDQIRQLENQAGAGEDALRELQEALDEFDDDNAFNYFSNAFLDIDPVTNMITSNGTVAEEQIHRIMRAATTAATNIQNNVRATEEVLDREFGQEKSRSEQLKELAEERLRAVEESNKAAERVANAKAFFELAGAVGSAASAFTNLTNISNIWNNQDLSQSEKIAQTFMNLTTIVTTLGYAIINLKKNITILIPAIKTLWKSALGPLLPIILAVTVAVAALSAGIIYLVKQYNKEAEAAKEAQERVERLTEAYNKAKVASDKLKASISNYDEAIKAMESLEKGTKEYIAALEEANEKAKELITTYKLFDDYEVDENGLIVFKEGALNNIQGKYSDRERTTASNLYVNQIVAEQAKLRSEVTDIFRDLNGWYKNPNAQQREMLLEVASAIKSIKDADSLAYEDNKKLAETLNLDEKVSPYLVGIMDLVIQQKDALLRLGTLQEESNGAINYYTRELAGLTVQDKYSEVLSKIAGDNTALYNLLTESMSAQISKNSSLGQDLSSVSLREKYSSNKSLKNYGYSIKNDEALAREYAKTVLGYSAEDLGTYKGDWGKGTLYTKDGEQIFEELSDAIMRKDLAVLAEQKNIVREFGEELQKTNQEDYINAIRDLVAGLEKLSDKYNVNFTNPVFASIASGKFDSLDFSSFINDLTPQIVGELKSLDYNGLLNLLGLSEKSFQELGYNTGLDFYNGWQEALDAFDEDAFYNRLGKLAGAGEKQARTLYADVQSRNVNYQNIQENDNYKELISTLQTLQEYYPELRSDVEMLNKVWLVGTEEYMESLGRVQDTLSNLNIKQLERNVNKALDKVKDALDEITDENGEIIITADTTQFEEAIRELLDANYEIDIAVHTESEQEFDAIVNRLDEIYDRASLIGEGFIVAARDVRELNNTFPGIIKSMEDLKDGTIRLNAQVVASAFDTAHAEVKAQVEATVAKLQMEATLLRQKQASYQRMADAARILAGIEVDSDMTASEARIAISDELANLETINSQMSAKNIDQNNKEVATSSQKNAKITSDNWTGAFNQAAKMSAEMAKVAINNFGAIFKNSLEAVKAGSFTNSFKGSSGASSGITLGQMATAQMTTQKALSEDRWAAYAEIWQRLADSAGAQANDTEGMIPAIQALLKETEFGFSNIKSGYGIKGKKESSSTTKEKQPEVLDFLEDEADRYHDINLELEELETNLDRLSKQQSKLFGKDLINNLNEQLDILEKQKEATKVKLEIAEQELAETREALELQGVTFGDDGYISNYAEAMQVKLDYANAMIIAYNEMSVEEQEKFKDTVEEAKQDYEDFKNQIERYDELMSSFIPDLHDNIQSAIDEQISINIEKFRMELELRLDMAEAERDFNEFRRKVIDGIKNDDIIGNAESKLRDFKTYFNTFGTGTGPIQKLTEQINATIDQLDNEANWGSAYGDDYQKGLKNLQADYEELMKQLEDMVDLQDEIKESYLDMIDEMSNAFDKQVNQYEYIQDLMNHDINVIGLVYGDKAYAQMATYYKKIEENNNQELDFLQKRVAYAAEMMEKETDPKAREKWEEEWMNSLEKLNKKVEDSLENINNAYKNAVNQAFDELNKKVTGGKGLDYMETEWDLINKNADQYLDTINSLYGIQELENKYLDAIANTDSLSGQQKLNDLMNEQIKMLQEKDKLTQYDVDRANMLYEIALKEIALEEAQQNKSTMRLRRDSQGNYRYQFVADEDKTADAQQDLLAAQKDLYNFDKEAYKDNLDQIYEYYLEFQEKYNDIMLDMSLTDEERQERILLLTTQYGELINGLVEQNEDIKKNLYDSTFFALEGLYQADSESFVEMTGKDIDAFRDLTNAEKDLIIGEMIPQWDSGVQHMADTFAGNGGLIPTCRDAFNLLDKATNDYKNSLDDLQEAAQVDFEDIANGYDTNIEKAEKLLIDNNSLLDAYQAQIDKIKELIEQLDDLILKYEAARDAAIEATERAYAFVESQKAEAADDAHDEFEDLVQEQKDLNEDKGKKEENPTPEPVKTEPKKDNKKKDGGNGKLEVGDKVTFLGGLFYNDSYGKDPHGNSKDQWTGKQVYITKINPASNAQYPVHISTGKELHQGDLGWLKKSQIKGYDTGGYTGNWNSKEGKLAVLHEKELVLKSSDTENILKAVNMVRNISGLLNNINDSMLSRLAGLNNSSYAVSQIGDYQSRSESVDQNVRIEASFPNVKSSNDIENALKNLVSVASQRAFNNKR